MPAEEDALEDELAWKLNLLMTDLVGDLWGRGPRLIRPSPAEEIEDHDPPARKAGHQAVVEVEVVRGTVHQHDLGLLARVVPGVDPVPTPRHHVLPVLHLVLLAFGSRRGGFSSLVLLSSSEVSGIRDGCGFRDYPRQEVGPREHRMVVGR